MERHSAGTTDVQARTPRLNQVAAAACRGLQAIP